ncbi:MAG: cytochrome c oxidase assembly protein [Proteobacteria bacterium]|nr:cytochrome c oxidase assembly protein [Pseudomonadota bacterium]
MQSICEHRAKKSKRTIFVLGGIVVGMFAFGFALVPLYQLFCNVTGYNGSSQGRQADAAYVGEVDTSRLITVQFDSTINTGLPWDFKPLTKTLQAHPGEVYEVSYMAKNNADEAIIAQAVPGITPWQATQHFNKMECFCFSNQTLEAGEYKEMPLRFVVSPGLPDDIGTLTLSYTFMNTDRGKSRKAGDSFQIYPAAIVSQAETIASPLTMNTSFGGSTR